MKKPDIENVLKVFAYFSVGMLMLSVLANNFFATLVYFNAVGWIFVIYLICVFQRRTADQIDLLFNTNNEVIESE